MSVTRVLSAAVSYSCSWGGFFYTIQGGKVYVTLNLITVRNLGQGLKGFCVNSGREGSQKRWEKQILLKTADPRVGLKLV